MGPGNGDALERPASITVGEWEQHRGELAAVSGKVAAVPALTREVKALSSNVALLRGSINEYRDELRAKVREVREDSSSDLRVELSRYQAAERERDFDELKKADEERRRWWWDLLKILVSGVAGGALAKWLHF